MSWFSRAEDAARTVLEDESVSVDLQHAGRLGAPLEDGRRRRVDPNPMRETHLGKRRDRRLGHSQLASLQVDPQRLAEGGQPREHLSRRALDGHDRVEAQATHHRVAGDLLEEIGVRRDRDDGMHSVVH